MAHRVGQALCYWILTETGQVIARTTVQPLSADELATTSIQEDLKAFDNAITKRLGDTITIDNPRSPEADHIYLDEYLSA